MKCYFVGIGGIGTSALAQLCAQRGDEVSGSNLGATAIWPQLESAGITLFDTHNTSHLPHDTDLLIYSEAVPEDNPERTKAKELNIPQMSYFQYLGEVAKDYCVIAVTGTHGKTTTAAMMAAGFLKAEFPATMIVGSKLKEFNGSNFQAGTNDWLVVEACEYRNNFQYLNPAIIILTNLELDHVDHYRDEDHYLETFQYFCQNAQTIVHHQNEPLVAKVLPKFGGKISAVPPQAAQSLELTLPGRHNRQNAALTIAAATYIEGLDLVKFKQGVANYQGAWRRLEHLGKINGIEIYDDYGHHPTEIIATLQALRERHPHGKIGLIFEPHQYSRTKQFFKEFCLSFEAADYVGLYPIYAARDRAEDKAAIDREDFLKHNGAISLIDDVPGTKTFAEKLKDGDVLIFMGAGNISELAHSFVASP